MKIMNSTMPEGNGFRI